MPDLPEFPAGINTELRKTPSNVRELRPKKRKRPPDPRRTFLWVFAAIMLLIFFSPLIRDVLAGR